jgi:hypothetical protein
VGGHRAAELPTGRDGGRVDGAADGDGCRHLHPAPVMADWPGGADMLLGSLANGLVAVLLAAAVVLILAGTQ